jgi:plastocyanin
MQRAGGTSRRAVLASGAALVGALSGCVTGGTSPPEDSYDIGMTSIDFEPRELTVRPGTEVIWRNTNSRTHTVTAYEGTLPAGAEYFASGNFDSQTAAVNAYNNALEGGIVSEGTYSHTFEVPGSYGYFCIPHRDADMAGVIEVTAEGTTEV